jgi:hypothetical protein
MATTVIGSSIIIDGEISGEDQLVVHGTVKGRINVRDALVVENGGVVEATVESASVTDQRHRPRRHLGQRARRAAAELQRRRGHPRTADPHLRRSILQGQRRHGGLADDGNEDQELSPHPRLQRRRAHRRRRRHPRRRPPHRPRGHPRPGHHRGRRPPRYHPLRGPRRRPPGRGLCPRRRRVRHHRRQRHRRQRHRPHRERPRHRRPPRATRQRRPRRRLPRRRRHRGPRGRGHDDGGRRPHVHRRSRPPPPASSARTPSPATAAASPSPPARPSVCLRVAPRRSPPHRPARTRCPPANPCRPPHRHDPHAPRTTPSSCTTRRCVAATPHRARRSVRGPSRAASTRSNASTDPSDPSRTGSPTP